MARDPDTTTPLVRIAELLDRGPAPPLARTPVERMRRSVRAVILRGIEPYARRQRELDAAILEVLRVHDPQIHLVAERHGEQIERLEGIARELILTVESLRRAVDVDSHQAELAAGEASSLLTDTPPTAGLSDST